MTPAIPYVQFQQQPAVSVAEPDQEVGENQRSLERIVDRLPPDQQSGGRQLGRLLALSSGQAGPLLADGETFGGELYQAAPHPGKPGGKRDRRFACSIYTRRSICCTCCHLSRDHTAALSVRGLIYDWQVGILQSQVGPSLQRDRCSRWMLASDALVPEPPLGQTLGLINSAAAAFLSVAQGSSWTKQMAIPSLSKRWCAAWWTTKVLVRTDDGGWQVADAMDLDQLAVPDSLSRC